MTEHQYVQKLIYAGVGVGSLYKHNIEGHCPCCRIPLDKDSKRNYHNVMVCDYCCRTILTGYLTPDLRAVICHQCGELMERSEEMIEIRTKEGSKSVHTQCFIRSGTAYYDCNVSYPVRKLKSKSKVKSKPNDLSFL